MTHMAWRALGARWRIQPPSGTLGSSWQVEPRISSDLLNDALEQRLNKRFQNIFKVFYQTARHHSWETSTYYLLLLLGTTKSTASVAALVPQLIGIDSDDRGLRPSVHPGRSNEKKQLRSGAVGPKDRVAQKKTRFGKRKHLLKNIQKLWFVGGPAALCQALLWTAAMLMHVVSGLFGNSFPSGASWCC